MLRACVRVGKSDWHGNCTCTFLSLSFLVSVCLVLLNEWKGTEWVAWMARYLFIVLSALASASVYFSFACDCLSGMDGIVIAMKSWYG